MLFLLLPCCSLRFSIISRVNQPWSRHFASDAEPEPFVSESSCTLPSEDMSDAAPHMAEQMEIENYKVFRKSFHVPEKWSMDDKFRQLFEHSYLAKDGAHAFEFVVGTLKEKGYLEDNDRMVHDYLHFMVSDLLASEGIPFITEDDIQNEPYLTSLFSDLTPDLIVKSAPPRRTTIIDIYIGRDQAATDKKKSKYKSMAISFDFIGVTELSMCRDLKSILSEESILYLASQFHVFKTEYQYWKSCAKLQRMLVNEIQNVPLKPLPVVEEFVTLKHKFQEALVTKALTLLNDDGI